MNTCGRLLAAVSLCAAAVFPFDAISTQKKCADVAGGGHVKSPYLGAIAVDARDGRVLFEDSSSVECFPASCTKLMTARLLLKAISAGRLTLDDKIVQTQLSCREEPSKLDLAPGESVQAGDALAAIMVKSANDIAVAIAEKRSGTVEDFVAEMNAEAVSLGMTNTCFVSPNGLPPATAKRGYDRSTPADLAKLAVAILRDQPEILEYTGKKSVRIPCRGGKIVEFRNHNNLVSKRNVMMKEVDGLKTGYFRKAGFSIVATGSRNGKRAVAVVVGSPSPSLRDSAAKKMLGDALDALDW